MALGVLRVGLAVIVAVLLGLQGQSLFSIAYLAVVVSLVFGTLLIADRPGFVRGEGLAAMTVDSLSISLLVGGSGGADSPFLPLYLLAAAGTARTTSITKGLLGAAVLVAGYLLALLYVARDLEVLLLPGVVIRSIALAILCVIVELLGEKLRSAREKRDHTSQTLADEQRHTEQLTKLISGTGPTLGLLSPDGVLRWLAEAARGSSNVSYAHAATSDGRFHQTAAGDGDAWPSWWHPTIQRLVLWSCRTGETVRHGETVHGVHVFVAVPIVDENGESLAAIVVGGQSLEAGEERFLSSLTVPAARAIKNSREAPAGRDLVSGVPNRESLYLVLGRELAQDRPVTAVAVGLVTPKDGGGNLHRALGAGLARMRHGVFFYDGSTFVILMAGRSPEKARASASKIRLAAEEFLSTTADPATVAVGFGVAAPDAGDPETLLSEALRALARARTVPERVFGFPPSVGRSLTSEFAATIGPETARTLMEVIEIRDPRLAEHSRNVSRIALLIGARMSLLDESMEALAVGALLHDIGKVGLPDAILHKPASLSPDERKVVERHPVLGARVLGSAAELSAALPAVKYHHERQDGKGYPDGIEGEQIPLLAKIVLVADAFDSMTQNRVYRLRCSDGEALEEIARNAGTQFDPAVVKALMEIKGNLGDQRISS